jgi:transcriptional regulator with XRE-family HTH domain
MSDDILRHIIDARKQKGLQLEEVAQAAQLTVAELQDLESGNTSQLFEWPVVKVKHLAEALDLNLSNLLGETILSYDEWALIWSALIEYSANRPGLNMKMDMKELIGKVRSFIPEQHTDEANG